MARRTFLSWSDESGLKSVLALAAASSVQFHMKCPTLTSSAPHLHAKAWFPISFQLFRSLALSFLFFWQRCAENPLGTNAMSATCCLTRLQDFHGDTDVGAQDGDLRRLWVEIGTPRVNFPQIPAPGSLDSIFYCFITIPIRNSAPHQGVITVSGCSVISHASPLAAAFHCLVEWQVPLRTFQASRLTLLMLSANSGSISQPRVCHICALLRHVEIFHAALAHILGWPLPRSMPRDH